MKLTRQKKIIVGVLALVLSLMVGYAVFSESLNIGGTASTGSSDFNIIFSKVNGVSEKGSSNAVANIKEAGKKLEVTVPNLEYPTAYAEFDVTIKNEGEINAILTGIETTGLDNEDIKVTYSGIEQDEILGASQEKRMKIKVLWDEASTNKSANASFEIVITYKQDTNNKPTTTSSGVVNNCTSFDKKDTYNVGDVIAICNNDTGVSEDFYVIKDNGDTVTALAKYNLLVGNNVKVKMEDGSLTGIESITPIETTAKGYGIQSSTAKAGVLDDTNWIGTIAFSNTNYWYDGGLKPEYGSSYPADVYDENSLLYEHVENYENYLKSTLGKTSAEARLITYDELENLGCSGSSCTSAPSWVYDTTYWSASAYNIYDVWLVASSGIFGYDDSDDTAGVRPVITISKSEI